MVKLRRGGPIVANVAAGVTLFAYYFLLDLPHGRSGRGLRSFGALVVAAVPYLAVLAYRAAREKDDDYKSDPIEIVIAIVASGIALFGANAVVHAFA